VAHTPNILLVITDQQRRDTLGCNGNTFVQTPHTDALAARGVNFATAATPFPVCTPARASLWTGVLPHAHGVTYNRYKIPDVLARESKVNTTIFELFRSAGYTAAYFGKWHLGEENNDRFDIWRGFNSRGGHWKDGRQGHQGGTYKPDIQTDDLLAFLASDQAREKPFIAVQSYYPPHQPFSAPPEFYAPYRGKGVPFAGYYAAVSALDHCLGRIMVALDESGQAENTLVVFLSDHGETFDLSPEKPHKFSLLDPSLMVPLVMAGPGVPKGETLTQPVGLEDIAPTLLQIAGIDIPSHMQGRSLFDLMRGATDWRDCYCAQNETLLSRTIERAIRTDRWKLILRWDETHELYDLRDDPEEELNIYGAPRPDIHDRYVNYADTTPVVADLATRLQAQARATGDVVGEDLAGLVLRPIRAGGKAP